MSWSPQALYRKGKRALIPNGSYTGVFGYIKTQHFSFRGGYYLLNMLMARRFSQPVPSRSSKPFFEKVPIHGTRQVRPLVRSPDGAQHAGGVARRQVAVAGP